MCVLVLFSTTIMLDKKRIAIFIDGGNFHHLVIKKLMISELDSQF